MKQARYGTTPIPMPKIPSGITALPAFASEVLKSLRALRDRPVLVPSDSSRLGRSHPFKVSANGDDTVTVASGEIIEFAPQTSGSVPNIPFKGEATAYAGTNSFLVSASGTLYVVLNVVDVPYSDDSLFGVSMTGFSVDSLSLAVDPTLSGNQISFPIAELTLTDGVVSVDKQILTYNPTLQLGYIFVYAP